MKDNLISRQEAIDALCSECSGNCVPCKSFPCGEVEAINNVPSVQSEHNWTPVSKGSPEEYGEYNVTLVDSFIGPYVTTLRFGIADTAYGIREGVFYEPDFEKGDVVYEDLIAWQPLPEPYKEKEE